MLKTLEILLRNEIDPAFSKRSRYIFSVVEKERPTKILDAGCGRGFYVHALSNYPFIKEIHGIDINSNYLATAKKNCKDKRTTIKKASIYDLPYPDKYFDFIICSEILEHLDSDEKALIELKRVLKDRGTLVITVPNINFPFFWDPVNWILMKLFNTHINKDIWWAAGIWADHVRLYDKETIQNLLDRNNFRTIHTKYILKNSWPFSHFILYGVGKNIVERLHVSDFDRFSFTANSKAQTIASIMGYPSKYERKVTDKKCLNLIFYSHKN